MQLDDVSTAYRFALSGLAEERDEYGMTGQLVADLTAEVFLAAIGAADLLVRLHALGVLLDGLPIEIELEQLLGYERSSKTKQSLPTSD